jgi:maltose phosphorylase
MAKIADLYYVTDPWNIIEENFNPEYAQVSESIFSLGNEYMGIRGYFEEGYSGNKLIGSYFNGIYEQIGTGHSAYKGIVDKTEFMVNAVDWTYVRIECDGEELDLNKSKFTDFRRELNMKTGELTRSFVWITTTGKKMKLMFERFLSMDQAHMAGQRLYVQALNFSGELNLKLGLDFSNPHANQGKNLWEVKDEYTSENECSILAATIKTKQEVFSSCTVTGDIEWKARIEGNEKLVGNHYVMKLTEGIETQVTKLVLNFTWNDTTQARDKSEFEAECKNAFVILKENSYHSLKMNTKQWWKDIWSISDIGIQGDDMNQQGIRFCIFQMHQTYHGVQKGAVIGAKGLTGEAYSGNTFWDTETYCLPFYIFNNVNAAKQLLMFRYDTLKEAQERAKSLDCKGAFYPIATISGLECCNLWQHASLQLQATTAVAFGLWHYDNITGDRAFVNEYGIPMLVEICRMLATRGDWNADHSAYGFYGVMGPDEFQMMVNNNCYTNYMGKASIDFTLNVLEELRKNDVSSYEKMLQSLDVTELELNTWKDLSAHMFIPYDETRKLFEQHEGFFKLPHVDVDKIPVEDFPLYHHWTYDRIYRNDMIKQPDVLMLMFLYNDRFTFEEIKNNYEYYTPRCIHESSLSPSVHSILASQIDKEKEAYDFFGFATRMDLDNYNRNSHEGLHTTSIAAAWMNIVYGFGGMRSDGLLLKFAPSIPEQWNEYDFRVTYQNTTITVVVNKQEATFTALEDTQVKITVYGNEYTITSDATKISLEQVGV